MNQFFNIAVSNSYSRFLLVSLPKKKKTVGNNSLILQDSFRLVYIRNFLLEFFLFFVLTYSSSNLPK